MFERIVLVVSVFALVLAMSTAKPGDNICQTCESRGCVNLVECDGDKVEAYTSNTWITLKAPCTSPDGDEYCFPLYHILAGTHPVRCTRQCKCREVSKC